MGLGGIGSLPPDDGAAPLADDRNLSVTVGGSRDR